MNGIKLHGKLRFVARFVKFPAIVSMVEACRLRLRLRLTDVIRVHSQRPYDIRSNYCAPETIDSPQLIMIEEPGWPIPTAQSWRELASSSQNDSQSPKWNTIRMYSSAQTHPRQTQNVSRMCAQCPQLLPTVFNGCILQIAYCTSKMRGQLMMMTMMMQLSKTYFPLVKGLILCSSGPTLKNERGKSHEPGESTASYRWSGWVWEMTGSMSRLRERTLYSRRPPKRDRSFYLSVKTSGKLPTFLEESVKYTSTYERNSGRSQLVTCRSDLETLGFWSIMLKNLSRQSALTPSHVFVGPTTPSLR